VSLKLTFCQNALSHAFPSSNAFLSPGVDLVVRPDCASVRNLLTWYIYNRQLWGESQVLHNKKDRDPTDDAKMNLKKSEGVRSYLYVSDPKVNSLFEQVKGPVATASNNGAPGRDDKVRAVENYLLERNLVGTPQAPKEYFKGILPMRWGLYNDLESRPENTPALVYFGGFDPITPVIVGLGGSSMHVVGHAGATSTYSRSDTPTVVRWISKGLYHERSIDGLQRKLQFGIGGDLFGGVGAALYHLKPPTQQLEFLAKTLSSAKCEGLEYLSGCKETEVVLGIPLYVQQTRPLSEKKTGFGLDDEWKEYFKNGRL
jgi:hypothetical protein